MYVMPAEPSDSRTARSIQRFELFAGATENGRRRDPLGRPRSLAHQEKGTPIRRQKVGFASGYDAAVDTRMARAARGLVGKQRRAAHRVEINRQAYRSQKNP